MFNISEEPNVKIEEGTWADYQGSKFLIANANSLKYQRAINRLEKPYRRKKERGEMDPGVQKKILIQAMAQTILLDWKDVTINGQPTEYTKDLAEKALANDQDFQDFVMEFSMDMANYKEETREEEGKS